MNLIKNHLFLGLLASVAVFFNACRPDDTPLPVDPILYSGTLSQNLTLTDLNEDPSLPDYCITGTWMIKGTLTIEPGVVIAFESDGGLQIDDVDGVILANGTAARPIVFTGKTKTMGFWRGVYVESEDVRNVLNNVVIEYAGSNAVNGSWYNIEAGLAMRSIGVLTLTNTEIRHNQGVGFAVQNGADLRGFTNNYFHHNQAAAMRTTIDQLGKLDAASRFTGSNGTDGVEVYASVHNEATEVTWPAFTDGSAYYFVGEGELDSGVRIQAGATLKFASSVRFLVDDGANGYLIANGTASNPITFTGTVVGAGPVWDGIVFHSPDVRNAMSYCVVENGGNDPLDGSWLGSNRANIGVRNIARVNITNCTIRNSGGCGIYLQSGTAATQSSNTFSGNLIDDVCP